MGYRVRAQQHVAAGVVLLVDPLQQGGGRPPGVIAGKGLR